MKHILLIAATLSTTFFIGCKKDAGIDPQSSTVQTEGSSLVTYQLASDGLHGRSSNQIVFTQGQATVSEIKFDAKGDDRIVYRSNQTRTINLFDTSSMLGSLNVPYGTYDKIKASIKFQSTSTSPALELKGNYATNSGVPIPFIIRFDQPFELKYHIKESVKIDSSTNLSFLNTLSLNALKDQLTDQLIQNATKDNNGNVVISSSSNVSMYNKMVAALSDILKVKVKKK